MTVAAKSSAVTRQTRPAKPKPIYYPTSDGKPMAEDSRHRQVIADFIDMIGRRFADYADVYVNGADFLYYEEGDPKARVSPDAYIVQGVEKRYRPFYKLWEEGGRAPSVVLEVTSKKTKKEDMVSKRALYERIKVTEYFLFDPDGDYLSPRLQGFRLVEGQYQRMLQTDDRIYSDCLGLSLVQEGDRLRLWGPATQEWLKTSVELEAELEAEVAARVKAEQRAEIEAEARIKADEELARLRAELEALKKQQMGA